MSDKAVLISIRPKWCELIASGKKTIEVRKTRPKIPTPFKCYIYCAKAKTVLRYVFKPEEYPDEIRPDKPVFCKTPDGSSPFCSEVNGNGKVIGEFVCDRIIGIKYSCDDYHSWWHETADNDCDENQMCLSWDDVNRYLGQADGYGWHISDLKIYDEPRELSEFYFSSEKYCEKGLCGGCPHDQLPSESGDYEYDCGWKKPIIRPPQSWCYMEEVDNG